MSAPISIHCIHCGKKSPPLTWPGAFCSACLAAMDKATKTRLREILALGIAELTK